MTTLTVRTKGTTQTALFESGRVGLSSNDADRYTSVVVYVFRHSGELPSFIIRPGGDCFTVDAARRQVELLNEAIEWLEANVPESSMQSTQQLPVHDPR